MREMGSEERNMVCGMFVGVESPSAEARKVLALCSRILQSTVTGIPLGQRNLVSPKV